MTEYEQYKGFYIREGPDGRIDRQVIDEPYYKLVDFRPDDVVMDVGANIGKFTRLAADCKEIWSFEPDVDNYALLQLNCVEANVHTFNAAIVGHERPTTKLYLANPSIHSTTPYRGRTIAVDVEAMNLGRLLDEVTPTVLKIDIEGAEYDLMPWLLNLPLCVREIIMEIHLNRRTWRVTAHDLAHSLEAQGFTWLKAPTLKDSDWTNNLIGVR